MAGSSRRLSLAAFALPLLFAVMSGLAQANNIVVNTTDGESPAAPLCSLPDAITAHNIQTPINGCTAGNGSDTIFIDVTGTILIDESLEITNGTLFILGPIFGCSGPGPCGITIDGGGTVQILRADSGTQVFLNSLTLNHGRATTTLVTDTGGGAVYADGIDLEISDCLFVNNQAVGSDPSIGGQGGALYGNSGNVVIVNSTFANNIAVAGTSTCSASSQAPVLCVAAPPIMAIESEGGAIYDAGSTIKMTNLTIANNSAEVGGGYAQEVSSPIAPIKGTILQGNIGGNCGAVIAGDLGYNISSDNTCPFVQITSLNNTDSKLNPLANNGGPTDTFALQAISPAINHIPVAACTDQSGNPLGTDQRLFGRPDAANPNTCDSGAYEAFALAPYVLNNERVQIARSSTPNTDQVNIGITFTANGDDSCELGPNGDEDALNHGFGLALVEGTCANLPHSGLMLKLSPFVVHTVNHQQYGTLFQSSPTTVLQQSTEKVSARLLALPTPAGACGEWTLNLEVSGLNTPALGLGGGNPFALLITDFLDAEGCFDITNAIVGTQTPPPPPGGHRRRVRR
ncbi:MAG TPA: choice-of-anchor Q domain-containing protein [Steroidobacteraceae bacterium]|nr:choice-of-anchor Q domain-containing protein [Steroidobacteraceae bacterium]